MSTLEKPPAVNDADKGKAKEEERAWAPQKIEINHTRGSGRQEFKFDRPHLETLCKNRFVYRPSFEIYGGIAGLFDYGPVGSSLKAKLTDYWRQFFVLEESMQEVECSIVTPEPVLRASGHCDRFHDFMVRDTVTNEHYRADHLLEQAMDDLTAKCKDQEKISEYANVRAQADAFSPTELTAMFTKYGVKSPKGNSLSDPYPFNLMFPTSIGPTGTVGGFLRPETAQGMFVNFKFLLDQNGGRLPFAAAQVGQSFRNEIAPRAGLIRVREFTQYEIEHFVHPDRKAHPKFKNIANMKLSLFPRDAQLADPAKTIEMTVGDAVAKGIIDNETLGYFVARVGQFLLNVGIRPEHLRFRQHLADEMAHYAKDCWDAEIESSYGWVECVGIADRDCYDLRVHSERSKTPLVAAEKLDKPVIKDILVPKPNKGILGKTFRKEAGPILAQIGEADQDKLKEMKTSLESAGSVEITVDGKGYTLTKEMLIIKEQQQKISQITYYPSVIEPSFGAGRIIYSILEHAYWRRGGDEARGVLSLSPLIAPVSVSILPLSARDEFEPILQEIREHLTYLGISSKVDASSTSVGRRYARTDEIGIPYGVTCDFDSLKDRCVTLRERDTTEQVRLPIRVAPVEIKALLDFRRTWDSVKEQYGLFSSTAETSVDNAKDSATTTPAASTSK